jgi:hypothetical protein
MMSLNKRQRWALVTGLAGAAGATIAEHLLSSGWRSVARGDPPDDPAADDVSWTSWIAWTAAAGVAIGLTQVVAKRAAAVAWTRATGDAPPKTKHRKRRRRAA